MGDDGADGFGAAFDEEFGGGCEGAGGFGHVVYEEDVAAGDFADDAVGGDFGGAEAFLGDDGHVRF